MQILSKKNCEDYVRIAARKVADYLEKNQLSNIIVGVSGGIDSAVIAVIGLRAIDILNKKGHEASYDYLFLDCDSDPFDFKRAKTLAKKFKFKLAKVDLTKWYEVSPLHSIIAESKDDHTRKIAEGNIKCRLRMITLYNSAQLNNGIYLDSDDWSEGVMGFWTKHGDEGDINVTQYVTKTEMYDIGEYLGVPEIILQSEPGDGLKVTKGNKASDQLGLLYIYIEYIMSVFIHNRFNYNGSFDQLKQDKYIKLMKQVSKDLSKPVNKVEHVLKQSLKTAYKRACNPKIELITSRKEFNFPEIGTATYSKRCLEAIKKNFSN